MTAEDWTLVKSVFSRALAVELDRREQWLQTQTALPSQVKGEVLRLLAAAKESKLHLTETRADAAPHISSQLAPGEVLLNRFEILEHLGCGAMGDVYRSLDRRLGEAVAIKTLRSHLVDQPDLVSRLQREVQLARRVRNENVCQVFELHQDDQRKAGLLTFFTMEVLSGETLAARVSRGVLPIDEARKIAQGIADGLTAIHSASLIHRDLKPANIFLVPDDRNGERRAVIADFGLCFDGRRPVKECLSLFGRNAVVGTPAYMSPEQLLGNGATQQSDVYSFGVVLFEMVTGSLPFQGETPLAIALRRLQQQQAPSPRAFNSAIPLQWEQAILACLACEPANRPHSAAEVIEYIDGVRQFTPHRFTRRKVWAIASVAGFTLAGAGFEFLRPSVTPADAPAPNDAKAEYHLKLGQEFAKQPSPEGIRSAIDEFRQAVTIDPKYADGWAELADAYCMASNYNAIPSRVARKAAEAAAQQGLALNGRLGKAHAAYAYALAMDLRRWRQAAPSFEQAIALNPKEPLVRSWYAGFLGRAGRFDESVAMAKSALQLDPGSFRYNLRLGTELFRARQFESLVLQTQQLVRLHPAEASGFWALGRSYEWVHQFDKAEAALRHAESLPNKSEGIAYWATLRAAQGQRKEATRLANKMRQAWQQEKHETNSYLSVLGSLSALDDIVAAIQVGIHREDETVLAAASNPYLDPAKNDPRYRKLLQTLNLA